MIFWICIVLVYFGGMFVTRIILDIYAVDWDDDPKVWGAVLWPGTVALLLGLGALFIVSLPFYFCASEEGVGEVIKHIKKGRAAIKKWVREKRGKKK
jgi:hypothetical protein